MAAYSIIIDSRLMGSHLPRCLATLAEAVQHYAGRAEVRVVGDTDSHRMATLCRRCGARFDAVDQPTIGARGNAAARMTSSETLIFPTPRGRLDDAWLSHVDRLLASHSWDVLILQPRGELLPRGLSRLWRATVPTGTLCVDRLWFERIGGFDPSLDKRAHQDLADRLRACHARVIEVPV